MQYSLLPSIINSSLRSVICPKYVLSVTWAFFFLGSASKNAVLCNLLLGSTIAQKLFSMPTKISKSRTLCLKKRSLWLGWWVICATRRKIIRENGIVLFCPVIVLYWPLNWNGLPAFYWTFTYSSVSQILPELWRMVGLSRSFIEPKRFCNILSFQSVNALHSAWNPLFCCLIS